jgi:mRNA interferase YafQ
VILSQTKSFLKDSKKLSMSDKHFTKFVKYLALLSESLPLPIEAKDHGLVGQWTDFREFHISGDLLVIYQIQNNTVKLVRIGTHNQLFE